jgi:aminoglycoside phosphotransferase (APT) family kinase protein
MDDDRLHAVLIEPQLERFREICGLEGVPLSVGFEGWHRHAILGPDRVFLFPRDRSRVPGLRREAAVLQAQDGRGTPAPRLLGQWRDAGVSPYPYIAVSRLPGQTWSSLETTASLHQVTTVLASLGRAIASWHRLDLRSLPPGLRRRRPAPGCDLARWPDPALLQEAATAAVRQLGLPVQRVVAWLRELEPLATLRPVLVHGDVNEGQILVDDELRVTGVLDWETAGIGHPLKDFDFGEWGYGIFARELQFAVLRRHFWTSYARERGGELPSWRAVHLFFCLAELGRLGGAQHPTAWQQAHLANTLELLRRHEYTS